MRNRLFAVVLGVLAVVPSFAQATLGSVMGDAADDITANVLIVVPIALGVAALCIGISYAWRLIKRSVKA